MYGHRIIHYWKAGTLIDDEPALFLDEFVDDMIEHFGPDIFLQDIYFIAEAVLDAVDIDVTYNDLEPVNAS